MAYMEELITRTILTESAGSTEMTSASSSGFTKVPKAAGNSARGLTGNIQLVVGIADCAASPIR